MRAHKCDCTVSLGQGGNVKCGEVKWGELLIICIKCQGAYYGYIDGCIDCGMSENNAEDKAISIYGKWKECE